MMSNDLSSVTIVGLCGGKGHGKDTAAQVLIDDLGFKRVSFADGLRKTVCTALRCNESYFLDPDKKEEIDHRIGKPRRFWLQHIGTEGFRVLWEDVWVNWWKEEILAKGYNRVVSTDLRFPNEIDILRTFPHTVTLRVTNPRVPEGVDTHASEAHYRNFKVDFDIMNDGNIADLHMKVGYAVTGLFPYLNSPAKDGYNK